MHCKPPKLKAKQQHMASLSTGSGGGGSSVGGGAADDDGDGSRSGKSVTLGHSPGSYAANNANNNNSNNNNNNNDTSTTNNNNTNNNDNSTTSNNNNTSLDNAQIQLKKQTLEQRKQELEKLLSEKSWLLQQLQKQETQILNGNYEYLNLNDIFGTLQQCKQDPTDGGGGGGGSAILRRKVTAAAAVSATKENVNNNNNNNSATHSNRHSEISNRSSEYDNYPVEQQVATQQLPAGGGVLKVAHKKRSNVSTWHAANTLPQTQQQQQQLQQQLQQQQQQLHQQQLQQQQHQQQLRQHYISQMTEQQHFQYTQQQVLQHQQQQQRQTLQHQHFHPRQQLITAYHSPTLPTQAVDAISLYSANSANVATLRQQPPAHLAQIQTPIMVQCDKYYLSPTHQSYNDGGFIKSSQNIKQYISPQASPTTTATLLKPLQLQQQLLLANNRTYDAISLSPSYAVNMEQQNNSNNTLDPTEHNNNNTTNTNLRWRSQSSIATKNHSSDTLNAPSPNSYFAPAIPKHMDEISIASFGSETQKKQKPKQWLESSLDGPVIRSTNNNSPVSQQPPRPHQAKPTQQQHNMQRDRARLSSQSMSSGAQRYNGVTQRAKTTRLLQDDDGKYAKLSQSTSYLNSMDALAVNTSYFQEPVPSPLPPRSELSYNFMSPKGARLLPATAGIAAGVAADKPALSPEIRIESPKNMTIVQQATFQPYKEITKPFEMSDFYKYSTKFKQKEVTTATISRSDAAQEK